MTTNRFLISDWHLGHSSAWEKFKKADGSPLRAFSSTDEMNNAIIDRHNATLNDNDTIYVLGDCVINKKYLPLIKQMRGRKILVRGNHDIFEDKLYYEAGFEQIHGVRVFVDKFILSHIPLFEKCVSDRFSCNVSGHLHANYINSPRYLTVCVEHTDYTPLSFEDALKRIETNRETFEQTGSVINYGGGVVI